MRRNAPVPSPILLGCWVARQAKHVRAHLWRFANGSFAASVLVRKELVELAEATALDDLLEHLTMTHGPGTFWLA